MKKRFGFTLAEVLITLGIIGVVAAMTIPTLVSNTNGVKFMSQYKKSLSTLAQAGLMATANFDIDYSGLDKDCASDPSNETLPGTQSICGLLNSTLAGAQYLSSPKTPGGGDYAYTAQTLSAASGFKIFSMADGSIVGVKSTAQGCTLSGALTTAKLQNAGTGTSAGALNKCLGFIDVNGVQSPNKEITCETKTSTALGGGSCTIASGANVGDVYPIVFHDGTVEPASNAARAALISQKKN